MAEIFSDLGLKGNRIYLAGSVGVHNIEKDLGAALSYKVGKHKYLYFSDHPLNRSAAAKIIAFAKGRSGIGLPDAPFPLEHLAGAVDDVLVMTLQYFINGSPTLCTQLVEESLSEDLFRQFDAYKSSPERMKTWLHELSLANCSTILNIRTAFRPGRGEKEGSRSPRETQTPQSGPGYTRRLGFSSGCSLLLPGKV